MQPETLTTLYAVRHPDGRYYADPDEWAVLAAGNPKTVEDLRQRASRVWSIPPDEVIVERFDLAG